MGGSSQQWVQQPIPADIAGLRTALGSWLTQMFNQQNQSYPGYFGSPSNPWQEMTGGGLAGMFTGGQPTGLQAQSNALAGFLGMPTYGSYNPQPTYYDWNYPIQNPQYTNTGSTVNQGTYGTPSGLVNSSAVSGASQPGQVYYAMNPQETITGGSGGVTSGGGNSYYNPGGGTTGNTQSQSNPYNYNWANYTLPSQTGGADYTGQSSWLNSVPGMVNQGIGNATSLIGSLLGQNSGGTVPHTAQNAFEAMLTTKGWNDQPISQAQNALAGLQGSSPSIWGNVGGNLNDIMATGAPVNVTPQWQQMTGAMDIARDKNLAQAAESYAAGNKRFGSGAANQFGNVASEAAAQQNALLGQMTQSALENAANRRLTATGQGAALGQMQAQLPIDQANALLQSGAIDRSTWANLLGAASGAAGTYGNMMLNQGNQQFQNTLNAANLLGNLGIQGASTLGNLGLEATGQQAQNAQQQYANQLSMLNALGNYGQTMNQNANDSLTRMYTDWLNSQQYPFLNTALQMSGNFPGGQLTQSSGGLGGALGSGIGAYAALLPLLK